MSDQRIKVTGYYTPDDESDIDPEHSSGLTAEGFDRVSEMFMGLEDLDTSLEGDD